MIPFCEVLVSKIRGLLGGMPIIRIRACFGPTGVPTIYESYRIHQQNSAGAAFRGEGSGFRVLRLRLFLFAEEHQKRGTPTENDNVNLHQWHG